VATLAEEGTWQTQRPTALFLLARLLRLLEQRWDIELDGDQAFVPANMAAAMQSDIEPAIVAYLTDADRRELAAEDEMRHLNAIVNGFLKWRARDVDERPQGLPKITAAPPPARPSSAGTGRSARCRRVRPAAAVRARSRFTMPGNSPSIAPFPNLISRTWNAAAAGEP